jgi:hypothetical protein
LRLQDGWLKPNLKKAFPIRFSLKEFWLKPIVFVRNPPPQGGGNSLRKGSRSFGHRQFTIESMTSANVYIGTSLDGFIARTDGDFGWLMKYADADAVTSYNEFIANIDVVVIGRGTFETVLGFRFGLTINPFSS